LEPPPVPEPWVPVALATLIGGAIRFWYALIYHPPAKYLYSDMQANVMRAYAIVDPHHVANPWDTFVPRGIVEICAWALKLFPDRSVEALTPLVYIGLRRCFGAKPARLATWLFALDYLTIGYTGYYLAENYLTFFMILSLALLRPEKPVSSFFSGLCLGLGSWFKAQAITLLPLWALALWWAGRRAKRDPHAGADDPTWPKSPPKRLSAILLCLGAMLWVVPESVLVSRIEGHPIFMSSNGGQNFYSGHCRVHLATCTGSWGVYAGGLPKVYQRDEGWPDKNFKEPFYDSPFYLKEGIKCSEQLGWAKYGVWMLQQVADTFAGWPGSTIDVWPDWATEQFAWARGTNLVISYLLYPLAFAGLWLSRRRFGSWLAFGLPILSVLGIAVLFLGDPRFRQPYDFLMFGSAALTLVAIWESQRFQAWLERWRVRLRSVPAVAPAAALARRLTRRQALLALGTLGALGVVMSSPLWRGSWFDAHESSRYVSRAVEYLHALRGGFFFPRWAPDFYGGFGSPFFDFFPPGVFALTAPFAAVGFSVVTALKITLVIFTIGGALGACALARGETGRLDAALVAGSAFLFAPYRFVDLFLRGDLAEYAAIALLPWAFYLFRELSRAPREKLPRIAFLAALCNAGVLLTQTVIGQWASEAIALLVLLPALGDWLRGRRFRSLAPFLALVGSLGLAAVYVLPAIVERGFVHFERLVGGYFTSADHLVPFGDFFKFDFYDFVGDYPPTTRMPFSIGAPLAIALVLAVGLLMLPRGRKTLRAMLPWWIGVVAFLCLMTPPARWLYAVLPLAPYVQFPWRFLGLVATFGAGVIGITWATVVDGPGLRWARWPLAALAIALIAIGARDRERVHGYYAAGQVPVTPAEVAARVDGTAIDEHLPLQASAAPTAPRTGVVLAASGPVHATGFQSSGTDYIVEASADGAGPVDMQLFFFPGWTAKTLSGPGEVSLGPSPTGLVRLSVPQAGTYKVAVSFGTTPVRTAAAALSLLTLLLLFPALKLAAKLRILTPQSAPVPLAPPAVEPAAAPLS
jgi:hypothetical protein